MALPDTAKTVAAAKGHLQRGELELAERSFREALEADPADGGARVGLAQVLVAQGRRVEAIEQCELVAGLYARAGREDRAVEVYRRILRIDADRPDAHEKLGELLHRIGQRDEGLAALKAAADAYERKGRNASRLRVLESLMALTPDDRRLPVRVELAECQARAGNTADALAEYRAVAAALEEPGVTAIVNGRGTPEGAKRYRLLLDVLQRIVALVPDELDAVLKLGRYQMAGRPASAIATLHAAIKLDRRNVTAIKLIDHAFLALGQFERAVVSFDEIKKLDPGAYSMDPAWREEPGPMGPALVMVDVLLQGNRRDDALTQARAIVAKRPGSIPGRLKLKDVFVSLGNVDAAIGEIANAVALALEAGDGGLAREVLQDALRLAPAHPRVRELGIRVAEQLQI